MPTLSRVNTVMTGLAGSPWFNSIWFADGSGAHTNASTAVVNFWGAVRGSIGPGVTITVLADVQEIDEATGQVVGIHTHPTTTMTSAGTGNFLPPQTQGLIQLNTGVWLAGRQIRGHIYVPGPTVTNNTTSGLPAPAYALTLKNESRSLTTAAGSPGQVVYSRKHHQAFPVVGTESPLKWAVLRSRRD